jgi:hypothetical protein
MMSNKGLANHMRFRTKFWQERQVQQQQRSSFLDAAVVQGERIVRSPFRNRAIRVEE